MCGLIVSRDDQATQAGVAALEHRGPDFHDIVTVDGWVLGHTRLSIVDLSSAGHQPMRRGDTTIVYNGETWNHKELAAPFEMSSTCDTEAVAWMLEKHSVDALPMIDGQFAVAWVNDGTLRAARDRVGEVPLHYGYDSKLRTVVVASEVKALLAAGVHPPSIAWVPPGSVATWTDPTRLPTITVWHEHDLTPNSDDLDTAAATVDDLLISAVRKRCSVADVPVGVLLSGGIDSSAVAFHALPHLPNLVAYTAVYDPNSLDRRCSHQVADALGIRLVEVIVPAPSADDLSATIEAIEMPHKAQVEIGWACLHLARRLQTDGIKVVLSGEGSDELWSSYGRSYHAEQRFGWHEARRRSVTDQHRKNYSRVNKVFMAHSVEGRLPFADSGLVEYGLKLGRNSVFGHHFPNSPNQAPTDRKPTKEKMVLRQMYLDRLPDRVVKRDKAAFQTDAGLPEACAAAVGDPQAFYRSEYRRTFHTKDS